MSADGPRRLLDYGDKLDGLVRGALEAERSDDVSHARLARIAKAVAAANAATPSAPPAPPPEAAPTTGWFASNAPWFVLAMAMVGGFVVIGTSMTSHRESAPVNSPTPTVVADATGTRPAPPETSSESPIATFSPSDLPSAPNTPNTAAPARASKTMVGANTEADEIALLARAHDALRSDPAKSLALCREHESRFAAGHFAQEREAVAIEALVYLGRKEEARRRWNAFRERYPSSSHKVHLESLFAGSSPH